ncbi:MAG: vWA domain-containing protein [Bacteroidales bacterium]
MSLLFNYPWWYLLACPLAGLLYAGLLYHRSVDFTPTWRKVLFSLRFTLVTLVVFLLFGPMIHRVRTLYNRPALVFLTDNSSSMMMAADSARVKALVAVLENRFAEEFKSEYDWVLARFDRQLAFLQPDEKPDFKGQQTALGDALDGISKRFLPGELAGVILLSDGINNLGKDPLSVAQTLQVPVFTIPTGDTSVRLDLALRQIYFNRQTFAGNNFPIEINLKASGARAKNSSVELLYNNQVVWNQDFSVKYNNQSFTFTPMVNAPKEGLLKFTVRIKPIEGEINTRNNSAVIYVDARKKPTRILMVSEGPHPDIGALTDIFRETNMFEAQWISIDEWNGIADDFDLVIFHGLPTNRHDIGLQVQTLSRAHKPIVFILSRTTDPQRFNKLNTGVNISSASGKEFSAYPWLNQGFAIFNVNKQLTDKVNVLPPLTGPEGVYEARPGTEVLFFQKISGVETPYPLIAFSRTAGNTQVIISGEGLWWWRNILYKETDTHQNFRELLSSMMLYLTTGTDKGQFRVNAPQRLKQGERAYFTAELFNPSFESINDPDVKLQLTDSNGKEYPFIFSRRDRGYQLDAGVLGPGIWKWEATTTLSGKAYSTGGQFVVDEDQAETADLQADHFLLSKISNLTGGKMIYPTEMDKLPEWIRQLAPPTIRVSEQESFSSVFDLWPVMLVLFILAAFEWAIRKYNGIL